MAGGGSQGEKATAASFERARRAMVMEQIAARGVVDPRVLGAMAAVPRHAFVDPSLHDVAYDDRPLPIGFEQTISQPYRVARATELAHPKPRDRALEVGAGCGYQAAVLAELCSRVFAVEIIPELAERARRTLAELGYSNVLVDSFGDGSGGLGGEHAPFDVILVSAGRAARCRRCWSTSFADGGCMSDSDRPAAREKQELALIRRHGDAYETSYDTRCRYVDLQGKFGVGGSPPEA